MFYRLLKKTHLIGLIAPLMFLFYWRDIGVSEDGESKWLKACYGRLALLAA
jgi:hypothetical protein